MSTDPEALATLALKQLDEALRLGRITIPGAVPPRVLALDAEHIVRIAQWAVTTLKARKPKFLEVPEDLNLKPTKRSDGKA